MTIETDVPAFDSDEPAGLLAGRLDALAHLFAAPNPDDGLLALAGIAEERSSLSGDELAAEHYRVLSHDLVPDAGVFLESDGMLGGSLARQIHERMARGGFSPSDSTHSPGHMVNELGFVAHLLRSGGQAQAGAFWHDHAAGWMPLVALHLQHSDSARFEALGNALHGTLLELQALPVQDAYPDSMFPRSLPEARLDLEEPRVGLARIGSYLAVPAHSGLVLSRTSLSRLGRAFRLPTGFGSRSRIVEGLLRSAAQYDAWETVCDALLVECDSVEACWMTHRDGSIWQEKWLERVTLTRSILNRMRAAEDAVTGIVEGSAS